MLKEEVIKTYGNKVRVRVSGILIIDEEVLLVSHKLKNDDSEFWSPPGGGVEFGESIESCLIREFKEEVNLDITIGDFINITEHIESPLHAIELFYFVNAKSNKVKIGIDPELNKKNQTIVNYSFKNVNSISNDKKITYHPILFQLISKN